MGVPGYFKTLIKQNPELLYFNLDEDNDYLFMDYNNIIHTAYQEYLKKMEGIKFNEDEQMYAFTQFFHFYLVSEDNEYLMNYFNIFYFIYSLMRYELIFTDMFITEDIRETYLIGKNNNDIFRTFLSDTKFLNFIQKINTNNYFQNENDSNEYSNFFKFCSIYVYIQLQKHSLIFDDIEKQFCRSFLVRDCFMELLKIEKETSTNYSINSISDFIDKRLNIYKIIKKYNLDYTEDIFNYLKTNQELFQNEITLGEEIKEIYLSEHYYTVSKHNVIFSNEDEKSQYSKYIEFRNNKLNQLDEIDQKIKDDKEIMNYFQILRTLYLTKNELRNIENKSSFTFIVQLILEINDYHSKNIKDKIQQKIKSSSEEESDAKFFTEKYVNFFNIYERNKMNVITFNFVQIFSTHIDFFIKNEEWEKIKSDNNTNNNTNNDSHLLIKNLYKLFKAEKEELLYERQNFYDSLHELLNYIDNEDLYILDITL